LSHTSPLLVLVAKGRPLYTRTLRGCGLQNWMLPLQTNLGLSLEECQQLLVRYGLPAPQQAASVASQTTLRLIANSLQSLVEEIERTLDFLGHQFRDRKPRRLWLFGGGALVRNLPAYLSQRLRIAAVPWQIHSAGEDLEAPLYGIAAGLSQLAWENDTCT